MEKEILFTGDELEFLMKMDRIGCVLTDDGTFYCDLGTEKLPINSRLPARIKGSYQQEGAGWRITYHVVPGPRTILIGGIFLILFGTSLISFAAVGGSLMGSGLFGILCAALILNYATQYQDCAKRFENGMK